MQTDIVRMYVDEGLTLREIGEKIAFSRQTVCNVLQDVGVTADQKGSRPLAEKMVQRKDDMLRMYVDENKSVRQIAKVLNASGATVARSLRSQGVKIRRGGGRVVFPELGKLKVGESLELPRVNPNTRQAYVRYYGMAKIIGIKVSVSVISEDKVRVTRKT
ncbi:MAG: hypothetical protein PSX80_12985 [bacterium]|nr:hypothetical protein [bacterium]